MPIHPCKYCFHICFYSFILYLSTYQYVPFNIYTSQASFSAFCLCILIFISYHYLFLSPSVAISFTSLSSLDIYQIYNNFGVHLNFKKTVQTIKLQLSIYCSPIRSLFMYVHRLLFVLPISPLFNRYDVD